MATNDTDPQREQPVHEDGSRTDPDGTSDAASLLASLAESAQPAPNVAETEGHVAAAYAGAPRRPPRPNDKTVENPAVFINATVPLPPPPSSGHQKLGPPAPPVVSMKGDPTVLGGARLFEALQNQTEPGERARNQLRIYFAAIAGVVVAALIAIAVLAMQRAPAKPSTTSSVPTTSTSIPSAPTAEVTQPPAVIATPSPSPSPSSSSSSSSSSIATPSPPAAVTIKPAHGRPHGSSTSPRPSGTFAEPDRHL